MRFSTGTDITYGADSLGPAVMIAGDQRLRTVAPTDAWRQDENATHEDGRHIWRPLEGVTLERTQRPVDNDLRDVLAKHIDTLEPEAEHPVLKSGPLGEAKRLFPRISTAAQAEYKKLIEYIEAEYGPIVPKGNTTMKPFVDDFGPELLVYLDGKPTPLPEMPPVYSAPANWRPVMWMVNNSMFGPVAEAEAPAERRVVYMKAASVPRADTRAIEGLIYFHSARFIIIHEAWRGDTDAPSLKRFTDLITSGVRPWKTGQME